MNHDIDARLRALFEEQLHVGVPPADAELLESGLLDSLQFVALLAHIELTFGVAIPLEQLDLDRVRTRRAIVDLVAELAGVCAHKPCVPAIVD